MMQAAAQCIQRMYRGHLMGRKPMHDMNSYATKIHAMTRGVAYREGVRWRIKNALYVQAHWKGVKARKLVARMKSSGILIQKNWRRFQAQLDTKLALYDRLDT